MKKTVDPAGREIGISYDIYGLPSSTVLGTGSIASTSRATHDIRGRTVSAQDGENFTTTNAYDAHDRLIRSVSASGSEIVREYDLNNNLTLEKRKLDATTWSEVRIEYDVLDRMTKKTEKYTGTSSGVTTFEYSPNDKPQKSVLPDLSSIEYTYDVHERVIREKRIPAPTDTTSQTQTTLYEYDVNGNLTKTTDPLGRITRVSYDAYDRPYRTVDPMGNTTELTYDRVGRVIATTFTDASGKLLTKSSQTYDSAGRVISQTEYAIEDGSIATNGHRTTQNEYDRSGKIVKMTDPLGRITRMEYDGLGRMTRSIDSANNETLMTYDRRGLVKRSRMLGSGSVNSLTTDSVYDADGRTIEVKRILGTGALTTRTVYDLLGRSTRIYESDGGVTDMTYDLRNLPLTETRYLTPNGGSNPSQ